MQRPSLRRSTPVALASAPPLRPRASVVRGVRSPRVLRDDWTVASASRHTDASVDRDLTREASTICLVLRPGPSRARGEAVRARREGQYHRFDSSAAFGKTPRLGVPPRCFPRVPPPGVLRDAPRRYPPQSQSGINYTIAYDDSGASTRLRRARLSFLKTSVRVCCALPSTIRAPHAHPLPRTPSQTSARISSTTLRTMPRTPPVPPPPLPGTPPGTRPHPDLPDDPLVRDPDDEDGRPSPRVTASGLERLREEVLANAVGAMRGDERAAVSAMVTATETAARCTKPSEPTTPKSPPRRAGLDADADRTALAVVFHARRRLGLEAADATVSGLFGVGSAPARSGADPSQLSSGPDTAEALADVGYSAEAGWESLAAATSEGAGAGASVGVARSTEIRPGIGEVRSAGTRRSRARGEDPIDAVSQLAMSASAAPPGETPAARGVPRHARQRRDGSARRVCRRRAGRKGHLPRAGRNRTDARIRTGAGAARGARRGGQRRRRRRRRRR